MGSVPTTDAEGRRWHSAFNATKKEIPPFGTVFCSGKRFGGDYSERKLPKDTSESLKVSWDDLQKKVGYGNQLLVISEAYAGFAWAIYAKGMFFHNGPTAIPPGKWGKVTQDYPCVARIVLEDRFNAIRTIGDSAQFSGYGQFMFTPRPRSFDLMARINKYGGTGWGWWGALSTRGYGDPPLFTVVDLISGFNSTQGLAWVTLGSVPNAVVPYELSFDLGSENRLEDGENTARFMMGSSLGSAVGSSDEFASLYVKDGLLCFRSPGLYEIDLNVSLVGSGGQAPNNENPWSQIRFAIEREYQYANNSNELRTRSQPEITLAPPVVRQGEYGQPSTYLTHYEYARLQYAISINEPQAYDPYADDRADLVRLKLTAIRSTNDPSGMQVVVTGRGTVVSSGTTTEVNGGSKSLITPG